MTRMLILLALLWCGIPWRRARAQSLELNQYAHKAWRMTELDPSGKGVQDVTFAQTPDGYLWLGTYAGLYRFDGVRATPWKSARTGALLSTSPVRALRTTRDGTLWIGQGDGLSSLREGVLTVHQPAAGKQVTSLFEDSRGVLWVGLREPTFKTYGTAPKLCAVRAGAFSCVAEKQFGAIVRSMFEDRRGNLWVVSSWGVWRWTPGTPRYFAIDSQPQHIVHAAETEDGAILASSDDGLKRLNGEAFRPYQLPGVRGRFAAGAMLRSRDGSLWVASADHGLYHVHRGKTDRATAADGLSSDAILRFFEDREGNVWVATSSGIDRFNRVAAPRLPASMGLSSATVWSVMASSDGSVWLSTPAGLNRWRNERTTVYADEAPDGREGTGALREVTHRNMQSPVYSLGEDATGRVWASTMHGVSYFRDGQFVPVRGGMRRPAYSIAGDRRGNLWVNYQFSGLYRWTPGDSMRRVMEFKEDGRYTMADLTADRDRDGIWASQQFVGLVHLEGDTVDATYEPPKGARSVANDLRMESDGAIWSASADGLTRIKDLRGAILTSRNGLPCNFVHWSIEDDLGWLWMRMSCGLVRIAQADIARWVKDPSTRVAVQRLTRYATTTDDQYAAKYRYRPGVTKASDGRIWFADVEGAGVIDPRDVPFNDVPPPVFVERVTADSNTHVLATTPDNRVDLPPRVRNMSIEFTALSLTAPERVRFRFMLEGQDTDWREAVNLRRVEYSNLAPQAYRFRVMAANNDGVWNTTGSSLDIVVAPAWNQTWWFFTLVATALAATPAAAAVAWQRRRSTLAAERTRARFDATLAERTRVARELHDTLLGDMAGVAMQLTAGARRVQSSQQSDATIVDMLSALSGEVQRTLVDARRSVTAMRTKPEEVRPLHEQLAAATSHTFGSTDIASRFEVVGEMRPIASNIETEIVGIATEAMANARSHSNGRTVAVTCTYAPRSVRVSVRDDGQGFETSHPAPVGHWGLVGMRERAGTIGATITITSAPGAGTEVLLVVPVSDAA